MKCPQCHSENRDGAKFCDECGAFLRDEGALDDSERGTSSSTPTEHSDISSQETLVIEGAEAIGSALTLELPEINACDTAVLNDLPSTLTSGVEKLVTDEVPSPQGLWGTGTMEMPAVQGAASSGAASYCAPDSSEVSRDASSRFKKESPKKSKMLPLTLLGIVLLAAIIAFATYQAQLWGGHVIPDVLGMPEAEAVESLEQAGFKPEVHYVKSDDEAGIVLMSDPAAGARKPDGAPVALQVSKPRVIPDVVGKKREEAEKLMADEGFSRVEYKEERSDGEEGIVLSVSVDPGTVAKAQTPITVTVSVPFTVPDVANMSLENAQRAVQEAGYEVEVVYAYTEDVPEGEVVGTNPEAGSKLDSGSLVTLKVAKSRASELVELTRSLLAAGEVVSIDGADYAVVSCDSVEFLGNEQTSFTVTAKRRAYHNGEALEFSSEPLSGVISWTSDNVPTIRLA